MPRSISPLRHPPFDPTFAAPLTGEDLPVRAGVRVWLILVAALVVAMIVVGGATRLTDSGLSITEWRPIVGALPPRSEADWQDAFARYKQIPQHRLVNRDMTLDGFKFIFWWEWGHRFLGRFIGIAFALPLAWFWLRGRIAGRLRWHLAGLLALGGLQGFAGWYMVKSGLVDRIDVSQYRLALHLGLAVVILAWLVWLVLQLGSSRQPETGLVGRGLRTSARFVVGLVVVQIIAGAFVAGMKAGRTFNTWPLMDGRIVPDGVLAMQPWWVNLFENAAMVQFNHRMLAHLVAVWGAVHGINAIRCAMTEAGRRSAVALMAALAVQMVLGIWTLLAGVPIWLGLAHQGGAMILLILAIWHAHAVR